LKTVWHLLSNAERPAGPLVMGGPIGCHQFAVLRVLIDLAKRLRVGQLGMDLAQLLSLTDELLPDLNSSLEKVE
jgi:hypothetical protein